jgi:N-ethylmaleimide reductase
MANNWPLLQELHMDQFYSADEKGYTDYPIHESKAVTA